MEGKYGDMYIPQQGDIIKINFNPTKGHEQQGYRPALVISNNFFNKVTNMSILCPITNTINDFPLHVPLDERTKTTGVILCEHIKSLDISERNAVFVEKLPKDILINVINITNCETEILD